MDWLGWLPGSDMVDSFLHPERGYEAAEQAAQKYYIDAQGKLQPYSQNGLSQFQRLTGQAEALNNPVQLQNQWAQSYEMSPQARQQFEQAKEAGLGAASGMGLLGSSTALNNIQQSAGDIMQNDRQAYMNDLMQKYLASIGIGQNLYGVGAGAAGAMANNAMNQGQISATNAYGRTNAPGEQFGKLLGMATNAGINYLTGGVSKVA